MEQSNQTLDFTNLRDLLTIVFKHKYKILITFLVVFALATLFAFQIRPFYEAKSVLLIKFGREFLQRPGEGEGTGLSIPPQTIMRGEIGILTSQDLMSKVINVIGAENLYPPKGETPAGNIPPQQAAMTAFEQSLGVTNVSGSNLIEVTFRHQDPAMAAMVVNTLVDAFKDKHLEVFSSNSTPFLESQQKVFQQRLRESEGSLAGFKQKYRVFSFDEQKTALLLQRAALDTGLKTAQNQISELEQRIAFIRSPRWTPEMFQETGSQPSAVDQQQLVVVQQHLVILQQQLATFEQRERELLGKYTDGSAVVQGVRQEIRITKDSIRKATDEVRQEREKMREEQRQEREKMREEQRREREKRREEQRQIEVGKAEGELSVVRARVESLRRQLGQVEDDVHALDARGRELQDLKHEVTEQEQNYQTYARKLEESLIMDDMDRRKMVALSVVEKAVPPGMPMKQKFDKKKTVAGGFFGGIAGGIALAFLLEFMAHGMTTPLSAEKRLGLPVMVAIAKKT